MENRDKMTDEEYLDTLEAGRQEKIAQKNKGRGFILAVIIVFSISLCCFIGGAMGYSGGDEETQTANIGASEMYIEKCTKEFIGHYLIYPHTLKIETIEYARKKYDDLGYEMWQTRGYFTSENKLGMRVNSKFFVQIKCVYEKDLAYKYIVQIDGKDMYRSIEETYD